MSVPNIVKEQTNGYLEQLHSYGLGIRYSRNLMKTQSASKALELSKTYLANLNLCGYFRFLEGDTRNAVTFGKKITRNILHDVNEIKKCANCKDKICIEKDFILIKSNLTFILICRRDLDDDKVDKLQDILAVFIDTLDAWLESYLLRHDLAFVLQKSLCELIESSRDLIDCHTSASDELMSAMVAKFPLLGLEDDQEDSILDIIKFALNKHVSFIEKQIERNNTLGDTLISSVDALNNSDIYDKEEFENGVVSVDDDDSIELF